MDPSKMNEDNNSGSEQQGDNSMEVEDDKSDVTQGACGGEEFGSEASAVDTNVGDIHLRSQPSTSGNDNRKRRSQSSHPFAEKISGSVWKVEPQPQEENLSVQDSTLLKIKTEPSSVPNVETVPFAKTIKAELPFVQCPVKSEDGSGVSSSNNSKDNSKANMPSASTSTEEVEFVKQVIKPKTFWYLDVAEHTASKLRKTSVDASSSTSVARVPDAKNIKEEPTFIKRPVKREDESGMLLSNDSKDGSNANISTPSDEIELVAEVFKHPRMQFYIDYSKINESTSLETSADASSSTNAATLPDARTIKDEPTSANVSSFTNIATVPDTKIKDEPRAEASSSTNIATVPDAKIKNEPRAEASSSTNIATVPDAKIKDEPRAEASSSTNIATIPDAKNIKDEPTSADASRSTNVEAISDVKNIKNEPAFIQRPVKREDESGMQLNNDCKDSSKPNISSASTSSEVEIVKEVHNPGDFWSQLYQNSIKCPFCEKSFLLEVLMIAHVRAVHMIQTLD